MSKINIIITLAVCGLASAATAWLGTSSGLFAPVDPLGLLWVFTPYLVLSLLAWGYRRYPIALGILPVLSVLVAGYGLFFLYHDWYWPPPTHPNPWRVDILAVILIPQWLVVGASAMILPACDLYRRWHGSSSAKPAGIRPIEL